jgi:hypothetical protein
MVDRVIGHARAVRAAPDRAVGSVSAMAAQSRTPGRPRPGGTGRGVRSRWARGRFDVLVEQVHPLTVALIGASIGFLLAHGAVSLLHGSQPKLATLFDLESESSFANWFQSVQHLFLAGLLGLIAWATGSSDRRSRVGVGFLAALFTFTSADEIVQLHEWLSQTLKGHGAGRGWTTGAWMVVAAPVAIALFGWAAHRARVVFRPHPGAFGFLVGGFALFVAGAAGAEVFRNVFTHGAGRVIQAGIEETMEGTGVSLMVNSALIVLAAYGMSLTFERGREVATPLGDPATVAVTAEAPAPLLAHAPAETDSD